MFHDPSFSLPGVLPRMAIVCFPVAASLPEGNRVLAQSRACAPPSGGRCDDVKATVFLFFTLRFLVASTLALLVELPPVL